MMTIQAAETCSFAKKINRGVLGGSKKYHRYDLCFIEFIWLTAAHFQPSSGT